MNNNILFIIIYNLFFKYFILLNLFLLSFFTLMFYDFIMIWFFLEITNFLFICLLNLFMKNKKLIFLYFLIQVLSSFMIIFMIIMSMSFFYNNYLSLLMIMALMMKLGIPPLHLWMIIMSNHLPWNLLFLLLTIQKIIPFYLFSLIKTNKILIYMILIICSILPPYMMLNMINFKKLLTYSSINQSSWMILLINIKNIIWFKYFLYYSFILLCLFNLINLFKMFMNFNNLYTFNLNLLSILFMFNLAGMPPFSLFYLKWYSIFLTLFNSNMFIILIIMMFSSFIMLYIYINMLINSMFLFKMKSKILNFKMINIYNLTTFLKMTTLLMSTIILII